MRASREPLVFDDLDCIDPAHVEALLTCKVSLADIFGPTPVRVCRGWIADDGLFDADPDGEEHLAFLEPDANVVFWHFESGRIGADDHCFALGQAALANPGTCFLNGHLNIFASPITWLRFHRDGIVVLDWRKAYGSLLGIPRIAVSAILLPQYLAAMQPPALPVLAVLPMSEPTAELRDAS